MKQYMNIKTGSIDTYDGWYYTDENGKTVNAVDLGEVEEMATIEIACDHEHQISFRNWLNAQGYDASIGNTTGNLINGIRTSDDPDINDDFNRLWEDFCNEEI